MNSAQFLAVLVISVVVAGILHYGLKLYVRAGLGSFVSKVIFGVIGAYFGIWLFRSVNILAVMTFFFLSFVVYEILMTELLNPSTDAEEETRSETWALLGARLRHWGTDYPGRFAAILYFYVSAIGIEYQWYIFKEFGVNVFDFAEASDFFLAAFRQPLTLPAGALGTLFVGYYTVRRGFKRRTPLKLVEWLIVFGMLPYIFLAGFLFAHLDISSLRRGWATYASVELIPEAEATGLFRDKTLIVIGTTESYFFFYDREYRVPKRLPYA
jgi:uncharacterized membrane protein